MCVLPLERPGEGNKNKLLINHFHILSGNKAIMYAKFRISADKFPIETDTYINIERQNRICVLCERRIGDELHYFSNCNNALLQVSREKEIGHIKRKGERFSLFNETNILMYALMVHDDTIIVDTAKYVKQIMITFDLLATDKYEQVLLVFYIVSYC